MRYHLLTALPLLALGSPALASGGYQCTAADGTRVAIVIGHAVAPAIAQVRIEEEGRSVSTTGEAPDLRLLQSWVDDKEIRIDLVDAAVMRFEARLRVRVTGPLAATGTLDRGGQVQKIACSGEQ